MIKTTEEILGLPVVSLAEAKNLGKIKDIIIDTRKRAVAGFMVQSGDHCQVCGVWFGAIASIGDDAMMIPSEASLIDPSNLKLTDKLLARHAPIKNCLLYTKQGKAYGKVVDFAFDTESGRLEFIMTKLSGGDRELISIGAVLTFGQNILIISECIKYESADGAQTRSPISSSDNLSILPLSNNLEIDQPDPLIQESVETTANEPDLSIQEDSSIEDIFAKKHAKVLLGKRLNRDFKLDDGSIVAHAGDMVDAKLLKTIIEEKQLVRLMVSVSRINNA